MGKLGLLKNIFKGASKSSKIAKTAKKPKTMSEAKKDYIKLQKELKRNKLLKQAAGIAGGTTLLLMESPKKTENSTKKVKKEPVAKQVINRAKAAAKKKIPVAKNK